jgi:hypothetical protein
MNANGFVPSNASVSFAFALLYGHMLARHLNSVPAAGSSPVATSNLRGRPSAPSPGSFPSRLKHGR